MVDRDDRALSPAAAGSSPIDHQFLAEMTGGDHEFEKELLQEFLHTVPHLMEQIHHAIASGDSATLARAAHTLKGSARAVGAQPLAEAALAVEMAAKAQRLEEASQAEHSLAAEWQRVKDYLERIVLQHAA